MKTANKFLISVILVMAMSAIMLYTESKADGPNCIIVKLELAGTIEEVAYWVNWFDDEHLYWLRLNTQLDFLFILTYSSLLFFALKSLLERFPRISYSGLVLSIAFIPGVLDVIENIFLLQFLKRDFSTHYFSLYYWCVHLKWFLLGVLVLLALVQLGYIIYNRLRSKG